MPDLPTTTLTAHFDASVDDDVWETYGPPAGDTASDASAVERWDEESTTDNFEFQGATTEPIYRVTTPLMELSNLDFDGSNDEMMSADNNGVAKDASDWMDVDGWTIGLSFYAESITGDQSPIYDNIPLIADENRFWGILLRDNSGTKEVIGYHWDGNADSVELTVSENTSHTVVLKIDGTNLTFDLDNGADSGSVASGNSANLGNPAVLAKTGSGVGFYDGRIGEIAIYSSALTGTDLSDLKQYFADKWLPSAAATLVPLTMAPYRPT